MDASKKGRLWESQRSDIISNLPENVLNHIISFLPTKDAIRSSVLSKRWKYLWTSIPDIDFYEENNRRMQIERHHYHINIDDRAMRRGFRHIVRQQKPDTKFLEFVNRVVTLHDASDIKRLRLWFSVPQEFPDLNFWLQVAVNHNVEEIDLTLPCKAENVLPCCLFTCHSLFVLKISAEIIFNPPPNTSFSNLKKLSLDKVEFSDELSAQRLFSSCPVLEELVLLGCGWKNIENCTICIPTLKSLNMISGGDGMVKISSINLTYLELASGWAINICPDELPRLDTASVSIEQPPAPTDGFAYRVWRLFSGLCNVKVLRITEQVLSSLMYVDTLYHIPKFHKLIHLKLYREEFLCYNDLIKLITNTPKLERLDLFQGTNKDVVWERLEMVPSCFSSSLKIVTILFFAGTRAERELLGFVLRHASVLQRMTIYCFKIEAKDKESLSMLPKVSESCVIEFRDSMP